MKNVYKLMILHPVLMLSVILAIHSAYFINILTTSIFLCVVLISALLFAYIALKEDCANCTDKEKAE